MPRISTDNYDTVASWNGSEDLFVVEQPDGTKVATPAMVKQFIEAGDFVATGEIKDGHGNILADMAEVKQITGSGQFSSVYKAYKCGKVVTLYVTGITNASAGQSMNLFTLPEGWRPIEQTRAYGSVNMGTLSGSGVIGFNIYANGRCDTYSYSAMSGGGFTISYITA